MPLTNEEKEALLNTNCTECGGCNGGCNKCNIDPCSKWGTVIGNITTDQYLKAEDVGNTVDCKKNKIIKGPKIKLNGVLQDFDPTTLTWDLEFLCEQDLCNTRVNQNDEAGCLSSKLGVCSGEDILSITPVEIEPGVWKMIYCIDKTKLPQADGKVKVKPNCTSEYLTDVITVDTTILKNDDNCKISLGINRCLFSASFAQIKMNDNNEYFRDSENPTISLPTTGGIYNVTDNNGYFVASMDTIGHNVGPTIEIVNMSSIIGASNGTNQISTILNLFNKSTAGNGYAFKILKSGYYNTRFRGTWAINCGVSSSKINIFMMIPDSNGIYSGDMYSEGKPNGENNLSINPGTIRDDDAQVSYQDDEINRREYLPAGSYIIPLGRLSSNVTTGPCERTPGRMIMQGQGFGLGGNGQSVGRPGISTYMEIERVSDYCGNKIIDEVVQDCGCDIPGECDCL